ncbi:reverse transcriptase domain-containing protein [Sphingopyxis kveilinensis]|uniref:reverse transcriptase domain-containing protein n=1 Tax=Sphingopyxis kveilinensis TaxID=3114367 RepID=UPI0030CE397F
MQNAIRSEIKRVSDRVFARKKSRLNTEEDYRERFEKRTGIEAGLPPDSGLGPVNRHFDPKYCKRNANFLAKTIWHKVISGQYAPQPALNFFIDKEDGTKRSLMAFSIPDTALANILMRRLRERNIKRFSPHSFAYHPDKNIFDAILDLRSFIMDTDKIYSVQIDFKNYFDSIPSTYLLRLLDNPELFSLTPSEKKVLREFIFHKYAQRGAYEKGEFLSRWRGTPQGSSISLILANLANHSLDTALEKLPGKFVRFADDVTALCESYEDAIKIERCFFEHCHRTGIEMNRKKSPGIAVLANKEAEIRTVDHIDYLGYRFTENGLILSDKTVLRIKAKISKMVSVYLTHYISNAGFNHYRVGVAGRYDWDLLGLISEIRNYLYGGLYEGEIGAMMKSGKKLRKMKGLMSFYALLDDKERLKHLDGWLAGVIERAMRKRNAILNDKYNLAGLTPSSESLIRGDWLNLDAWKGDQKPEVRLPSFVRGWRAARKYYLTFGLKDVEPPKYGYQYKG